MELPPSRGECGGAPWEGATRTRRAGRWTARAWRRARRAGCTAGADTRDAPDAAAGSGWSRTACRREIGAYIDLSDADPSAWGFLRQLVERYDAAIFHLPDYAKELSIPQVVSAPAIDPLSPKNCELEPAEIAAVLEKHGLDPRLPIVLQVSRYDRLKDPLGVIRGFKLAARSHPCQLVLVGEAVADDPEGEQVLAEVREAARGDPDIHPLVMAPGTAREVNALQRSATIVVQKSVREGFGLVVTEAMWKAKPVIGGAVGGIKRQILQGQTGYLVHSVEGMAYRVRQLLGNPEFAQQLGANARRYVLENFLPTTYLRRWLLTLLSMKLGTSAPVVELR